MKIAVAKIAVEMNIPEFHDVRLKHSKIVTVKFYFHFS